MQLGEPGAQLGDALPQVCQRTGSHVARPDEQCLDAGSEPERARLGNAAILRGESADDLALPEDRPQSGRNADAQHKGIAPALREGDAGHVGRASVARFCTLRISGLPDLMLFQRLRVKLAEKESATLPPHTVPPRPEILQKHQHLVYAASRQIPLNPTQARASLWVI